jgi:hypothetical protein
MIPPEDRGPSLDGSREVSPPRATLMYAGGGAPHDAKPWPA